MKLPLRFAGWPLEEKCLNCQGAGMIMTRVWKDKDDTDGTIQPVSCGVCGGLGMVPTRAGRQLLVFVERYGGGHGG